MLGVPFADIFKGHAVAFAATVKYQRDYKELQEKSIILDLGQAKPAVINSYRERVAELKNELAESPVRELIEAGVFQTIIEDVDNSQEQFTYKSQAREFIGEHTPDFLSLDGKKGSIVKTVAKNVFMTHDSKAYKVMNQAAQLSDFVARYTLHQHYTTRTVNPLSKKDSIAKVVSIFVDYDLPTHRAIQYGNDMGVFWFTKYNFRIQRIILEAFAENPARVISLIALQGLGGELPDFTDGTILQHNPLNMVRNPLEQLDVIGEIGVLNVASAIL